MKAPLAILLSALAAGCSSSIPSRPMADLIGQPFPSVRGEGLDNKPWALPADLAGKPALLLIGYRQNAQFDIDRWMLGILMAKTPVAMYEIPTISGLLPGLVGNQIDSGMRGGIPPEAWSSVITVYADAHHIERFTGTELGNNARVLLLDANGTVVWAADRGYLPQLALELDARVRSMTPP